METILVLRFLYFDIAQYRNKYQFYIPQSIGLFGQFTHQVQGGAGTAMHKYPLFTADNSKCLFGC